MSHWSHPSCRIAFYGTAWTFFLASLLSVTAPEVSAQEAPPSTPTSGTKPAKAPSNAKAPPANGAVKAQAKGADKNAPADSGKTDSGKADSDTPATGDFAAQFEEWKTLLKDMRQLRLKHASAPEAEKDQHQKQWTVLVAKGKELLPQLRDAGLKAYTAAPNEDPQLARFLVKMAADAVESDDYDTAAALSAALIEHESGDKSVYNSAAIAAYAMSDFDTAEKYFKVAREAGALSTLGTELSGNVAEQRDLWEKESEIRKAEAEKNDLPRVKLTTNKGEIVIELFENEAPDTVGNFISLVEKKFYDGTTFHRVLKNFMAQGGDPKGDGTGGPGYSIFCECHKPEYRRHFRGALSMAHSGRDTGGSQFFLTFLPTPHLNGLHTCFGRVIEGTDVLAKLQKRDPMGNPPLPEPDKIITAEVVRKRDHAYAPKKVE